MRTDAERELKHLLRGEQIEQDLLGLLVAAGGGLSVRDLTQLTGRLEWEIDERLGVVSGRTFRPRDSTLGRDRPDVFLLAHEELQQAATVYFGPARLDGYVARLRQWAEDHRRRGWPPETPDYLLGGYFAMLQARDEQDEMVALATDRGRQDRMAALTSSDTSALTELAHCLSGLAARPEPDLVTMARLAMHREFLNWRGADVPVGLPELLLRLGYRQRAAGLLRAIRTDYQRDQAFDRFVAAATQTGDMPWAEQWWCSTWPTDRGPDEPQHRRRLLAQSLIKHNHLETAARIAEDLTDPGDRLHVAGLLDDGPVVVREPRPAEEPADGLPRFAEEDLALLLGRPFPVPAEDIERAIRAIEAARAGRWQDADELTAHIRHWQHREQTRRRIAILGLLDGRHGFARRLAYALEPSQPGRTEWDALAALLADPQGADVERASIVWPGWMWEEAMWELVHRGELERAQGLAAFPFDSRIRSHLLTELAIMLAEEHPRRAEEIAHSAGALARTVDQRRWIYTLEAAVDVLTEAGRADHARAFLARALPRLPQTAGLDRDARFDIMLMRASAAQDRERPALLAEAVRFAEAGDDEIDLRSRLGSVAEVAADHRHHTLADALLRRISAIEPDNGTCAELAALAIRQGLASIARKYWRAIPDLPARLEAILHQAAWSLMDGGDREAVGGIIQVAAEFAACEPDAVPESLRAGIECLLALCDGDDDGAEALAGSLPDMAAGWVRAELAGRWTARGELARAEDLLASAPDITVAAKMAGALAARGAVRQAIELATSAVPYGEGDVLIRASAQCQADDARRLVATAFVFRGYWPTAVRAAARLEPAVATAVADEIVALMES